uniref:Uncharacterized protein n=1 Tax=Arundo donax TaxID=35708 RepID=A0A0A9BBY6_ARUDO
MKASSSSSSCRSGSRTLQQRFRPS